VAIDKNKMSTEFDKFFGKQGNPKSRAILYADTIDEADRTDFFLLNPTNPTTLAC
jgi:hypothetical protein